MISSSDAVTSIFGYWPEFADARLISFSYSAEGIVTLGLFYIDGSAGKGAGTTLSFTCPEYRAHWVGIGKRT